MPTPQPNAARRYARITSDARRLAAVRATGLPQGRGPRDRFERLAAVAARLLDAPVAIVSLVDAERDVWVGLTGVPPAIAAAGGTTMRPSFCQAIIAHTGDVLAVRDARNDSLYSTFPSVRALGVVACLGIPLVTRTGLALGSCCVYDMRPRDWSADDIDTLRVLAAGAVAEMERLAATVAADDTSSAVVRYLGAAIDTIDTLARVMPNQCDTSRITRVSRTAGAVARQFATLASTEPASERDGIDLAHTAHDVWRLLQIVAGEEASVTLDFADGLPPVAANDSTLVRVLITLVAGARDALGGRGWIQVAGDNAHERGVRLTVRAINAGAPLGVPLGAGAIAAADQLLRELGGTVATHDETIAVALLRAADRRPDSLE
jgi:GAF domain-containing protein